MIDGIHHLGFTVRDVEASAAWYTNVLGFEISGNHQTSDGARRKLFLSHPGLAVRLGLVQHSNSADEPFDERRVGLDHLAFAARDADVLDQLAERLLALGVTHSPVAPANSIDGAHVLVFRDPDGIQLELFHDPTTTR